MSAFSAWALTFAVMAIVFVIGAVSECFRNIGKILFVLAVIALTLDSLWMVIRFR